MTENVYQCGCGKKYLIPGQDRNVTYACTICGKHFTYDDIMRSVGTERTYDSEIDRRIKSSQLCELLLKKELIDRETLQAAISHEIETGARFFNYLFDNALISPSVLFEAAKTQRDIQVFNFSDYPLDRKLIKRFPRKALENYAAIPISSIGRMVTVAMTNPFDNVAVAELQNIAGNKILPVLSRHEIIHIAIQKAFHEDLLEDTNQDTFTLIKRKLHNNTYGVIKQVGQGGFGQVYLAFNLESHDYCALKRLDITHINDEFDRQEYMKRFEREISVLKQLNHPNITRIYDHFDYNDTSFIVLEYISGGSLREYMKKAVSVREILNVALQACYGLEYLHKKNFVHRDIKPENILLSSNKQVKIADFGLVKVVDPSITQSRSMFIGTKSYASPEQKYMPKDIDLRSDIYSFSVVFYEMLTKRHPFPDESALMKPLAAFPESIRGFNPEVPDGLEEVIFQNLSQDRDERFPSMEPYINHLKQFV